MTNDTLATELRDHVGVLQQTARDHETMIAELVELLCGCFRSGNKVLLCGNGGSAADAQHVAAEFVNRFRSDRGPLPALALTTDSSILTSVGNDSSYEEVFARQVEALAAKGDILVGISTSGRSANVHRALKAARLRGAATVGFTGQRGRDVMGGLCDLCLVVASADTARIQECHEFIFHVVCGMVETQLFQNGKGSVGRGK